MPLDLSQTPARGSANWDTWLNARLAQAAALADIPAASGGGTSLNVKASPYNAKGDGTTDDTAAVQAALNAADTAGGSTVYFPHGNYLVGPLTVRNSTFIRADGWNTTVKLRNGGNGYIFTFAMADNTQLITSGGVRDIRLDCNSGNQSAASGGVNLDYTTHVVIDHVSITSPYHAGVMHSANPAGSGWPFGNTISNCEINLGNQSPDAANSGYAIDMQSAEESYIFANEFSFNGKAHYSEGVTGNNSVWGNTFEYGKTGLQTNGSRGSWSANHFDTVSGDHFRVTGNENVIYGNTAFEIGVGNFGQASWLRLAYGATANNVYGNLAISSGTAGTTRSWVQEEGGTSKNYIHGNTFRVRGALGVGALEQNGTANLYQNNVGIDILL